MGRRRQRRRRRRRRDNEEKKPCKKCVRHLQKFKTFNDRYKKWYKNYYQTWYKHRVSGPVYKRILDNRYDERDEMRQKVQRYKQRNAIKRLKQIDNERKDALGKATREVREEMYPKKKEQTEQIPKESSPKKEIVQTKTKEKPKEENLSKKETKTKESKTEKKTEDAKK